MAPPKTPFFDVFAKSVGVFDRAHMGDRNNSTKSHYT